MTTMPMPIEPLTDPLPSQPLERAAEWLAESWKLGAELNPNAMALATSTADGKPSVRIVLCKQIAARPGYVVFYTNYQSRKGQELTANPRAAAVLHFDPLQCQVRIEGLVERSPASESDAYYASRPLDSRIGAWASAQSEPIDSREHLAARVANAARRLGVPPSASDAPAQAIAIPRPPHWGGYRLWAEAVELWVQGPARIHDRVRWTRELTRLENGSLVGSAWSVTRLQP